MHSDTDVSYVGQFSQPIHWQVLLTCNTSTHVLSIHCTDIVGRDGKTNVSVLPYFLCRVFLRNPVNN